MQPQCKNKLTHQGPFRTSSVTDKYSTYMAKDELEKLLIEATANENWNISNTKMLQISDATYEL
jgi:hypothetical protein